MAESSNNQKTPDNKSMAENGSMAKGQKKNENRQDELIDDEDAIERLLMDNAFDNFDEDEEDEFAEIDELISDRLENSSSEPAEEESDDVDELIASVISSSDQEKEEEAEDDFIEIDEFADDEFSDVSDDSPAEYEADAVIDEFAEDEPENNDEGFLATDFDISAEEGQDEIVMDNVQEEPVAATTASRDQEHLDASADKNSGRETEIAAAALATISAQLAELQNEQHIIRQQLETVEAKDASMAMTDELDGLNSEQKKLQRRLTAIEQNKPVFAYAALGIAILALLVGGGLGFVALSADSKVTGLSETFLSLEEQVDAWMAKSKNQVELSSVTTRLDKVDMEVANFSAQIAAVNKKLENAGGLYEVKKLKEQIDQLNERNMQSAAVIEELQQKVDKLEKQKNVVAKKNSKKAPVVKEDWKVNLVSFKQEWYAKRKAAEFEKQGIPAEVMRVVVKGEPWYRLRVKGFATKYKAAAYAAKVKKTLNLSSVWVTKN